MTVETSSYVLVWMDGLRHRGPVAGKVERRLCWFLLVDKGPAQLRVRLVWPAEVPAHHGEFCLAVAVERLGRGDLRQPSCLGGQPRFIVGAAGQFHGQGSYLPAVPGDVAADYAVDQAAPCSRRGTDRKARPGELSRLLRADPAGQRISPVLRAVQAHQPVMRIEHCAAAAPDLIGGEREHQPSGGGAACQRGHREPAGSGQDCLDQVIDGADVPPGLLRRVVSGLDDIEMNPVCEYVCCSAEDDYPHVAVLGVPVCGEEPAALIGAHGAAGEGEFQVADAVRLSVADLLVGPPARRHLQRSADLRHGSSGLAERQRGWQFERGRPAGRWAAAQLRDPDCSVGRRAADRPASPCDDRSRLTAQVIFLMPAVQEVLDSPQHVENTWPGVGRPQFGQHRGRRLG